MGFGYQGPVFCYHVACDVVNEVCVLCYMNCDGVLFQLLGFQLDCFFFNDIILFLYVDH